MKNLKNFYNILPYNLRNRFTQKQKELLEGDGQHLNPLISKSIPSKVQSMLDKYGDKKIKYIWVGKNAVKSTYLEIIDALSLGTFSKLKNSLGYDNIYHLFLLLQLEDDTKLKLEKIQVVNLEIYYKEPYEQMMNVLGFDPSTTRRTHLTQEQVLYKQFERIKDLNEFYNNGITQLRKDGKEPYLYDIRDNNCQIFVDAMLTANALNSSKLKAFVMQSADKIIDGLPIYLRPIIDGLTDLGGFLSNLGFL